MKKKGFTLIELLVVIAIIAMLLAILMPALGKVKRMAMRIVCATNLKGMGTAHMTYGLDYDDEFAAQGGRGTHTWDEGRTGGWARPDKDWANDNTVSIAASLYLLVREADVSPASFICKNSGDKEFAPSDFGITNDLTEIWDFGDSPGGIKQNLRGDDTPTVSYAYQQPYSVSGQNDKKSFSANGSGNPSNAIMADRNPWCDTSLEVGSAVGDQKTFEKYVDAFVPNGQKWEVGMSNSASHSREGQNVLFGDGHVEFSRTPSCGYEGDNIFTRWVDTDSENLGDDPVAANIRVGKRMGGDIFAKGYSQSSTDSVLVSDSMATQ